MLDSLATKAARYLLTQVQLFVCALQLHKTCHHNQAYIIKQLHERSGLLDFSYDMVILENNVLHVAMFVIAVVLSLTCSIKDNNRRFQVFFS